MVMAETSQILTDMNARSREVFRRVVEGYLASGDPVGSRSLTRDFSEKISAATIRNVMQDLEYLGLLDSPHVSAGRTQLDVQAELGTARTPGLFLFVDVAAGSIDLDDVHRHHSV